MKIDLKQALTREQIHLLRRRGGKEFHPDLQRGCVHASACMSALNQFCDELLAVTPPTQVAKVTRDEARKQPHPVAKEHRVLLIEPNGFIRSNAR